MNWTVRQNAFFTVVAVKLKMTTLACDKWDKRQNFPQCDQYTYKLLQWTISPGEIKDLVLDTVFYLWEKQYTQTWLKKKKTRHTNWAASWTQNMLWILIPIKATTKCPPLLMGPHSQHQALGPAHTQGVCLVLVHSISPTSQSWNWLGTQLDNVVTGHSLLIFF